MDYEVKKMTELTPAQLLKIMAARIAVFVVEQRCPYQEIDQADETAWHTWLQQDSEIVGYTRIIDKGDAVSIGRVLTAHTFRGKGYGRLLMEKTLAEVKGRYPGLPVILSAQEYAIPFYQELGFRVTSEVYLEDDIPHVDMELER